MIARPASPSDGTLDSDVTAAAHLRLLALALAPPTQVTLDEVAALAAALVETPDAADVAALAAAATGSLDDVAIERERLLGVDGVSPYEAATELDPFRQARLLADVAGFYAAWGAEAHGAAADRPDHAGAELEFLAYLELRRIVSRANGDADEHDRCAAIARAFWLDHAGRWLPAFFATLEQEAGDDFHAAVAQVGRRVVAETLDRLELAPDPARPPHGRRLIVEADELECGAADLASPIEELAEPHRARRRRRAGAARMPR